MMRRICYLALLAAGVCQMMLYDFQGLRFLFCCALCIPAASALVTLPQAFRCRVTLKTEQVSVSRGDVVKTGVRIRTNVRGLLPVSGASVGISWQLPGEKRETTKLRLRGLGRNSARETVLELAADHCGRVRIELTKAVIYDSLGLFSFPVTRGRGVEICITPVITPILAGNLEEAIGNPWNSAGEKEGDLLLREFQPGDSLHRIYWKLVAKDGEMQVRDTEKSGMLTFYLSFSDAFRVQAENWDRYLDRACSLLYFFVEEARGTGQILLEVVWKKGERFFRQETTDADTLQAWVKQLLLQETGEPFSQPDISSLEQGFHLEEDCRLYFGEQCVYEE